MPRTVEISLPSGRTAKLLENVRVLDEVIGIRVQSGVSVKPPGDVVAVTITDRSLPLLMELLDRLELTSSDASSVSTSRPDSIISVPESVPISSDYSRASWEELESMLNKESGMNFSSMANMAIAGLIAAAGILTNSLHVVVGAMVIAPGFAPIARISMGAVSGCTAWRRGVRDTFRAYLALILGATIGTWLVAALGHTPESPKSTYFAGTTLLDYWTGLTAASLLTSTAAAVSGGILLSKMRSTLTAGVMIALALIPAATLIGIGFASGRLDLAAQGALRLVVEVAIVALMTLLVFGLKRWRVERRRSSM
ncbi:DUF389 domain-containing protein [Cognatilysobacter bugurensis]|uniref:DUF389 domain-containing protein n=1 Tax=Cognatilysobacter bugurensis TaxID=543356 RepID=A0A918T1C0_9GAMM|nr:DUF389 domain-containing protein [Lysobacter bugurensis]GHA83996.1 hypothetical protein GCM10007067_22710 [Lysobacter bugurensis]